MSSAEMWVSMLCRYMSGVLMQTSGEYPWVLTGSYLPFAVVWLAECQATLQMLTKSLAANEWHKRTVV